MALQLTSSGFTAGNPIPTQYTCDGQDQSPPLSWNNLPANTGSLALICDDPDAPGKIWVHWLIFNLPADTQQLESGIATVAALPNSAKQGKNDFGRLGYGGPCPPRGNPHRYFFRLYALDSMLTLEAGCTRNQLDAAMKDHILAQGELMGTYQRK